MTVFTGSAISEASLIDLREKYRTPHYFEWRKSGTAFTIRGVEVVYILGFQGGIVKVGQTADFLTRLTAHRSSPRTRGRALECGWRLGTTSPLADELTLLRLANDLGGIRMDRAAEWFTGVDVHALISKAQAELLPTERPQSTGSP